MNLTTKGIIKFLPFNAEYKHSLLGKFDTLSKGQQFEIGMLVWDAYSAIVEMKIEENVQKELEKASKGEEKLDENLYKEVVDKTLAEVEGEYLKGGTTVDLGETRVKLQKIIENINSPTDFATHKKHAN